MAKYRRETYQNPDRPPKRGHKGCLVVIVLFVVLLAAAAFGAFSVMQDVNGRDKLGDEVVVTVQQGENSASIARSLKDAGVIKYPNIFRYYLKYTGKSANLQYGDFTLVQGQSYDSIIETMSQYVKKETVSVTFPEGITAQRFAQLMEEAGLCSAEEFLDVANNGDFSQYEFWNEIPEDPNRFMKCEGYLFPDTYEFFVDDTVYNYVDKLYAEFDTKVTPEMRQRASELGMTLEEVITLASFVQEEAGNAEDARVSAVFHNRLEEGSPYPRLESNASSYVQNPEDNNYIYNWIAPYYGGWDNIPENIYNAYNTYELNGLPAGPISNPGIDAIEAALYPDGEYLDGKYYFFVTDKNGVYYYAKTKAEHDANVSKAFNVK